MTTVNHQPLWINKNKSDQTTYPSSYVGYHSSHWRIKHHWLPQLSIQNQSKTAVLDYIRRPRVQAAPSTCFTFRSSRSRLLKSAMADGVPKRAGILKLAVLLTKCLKEFEGTLDYSVGITSIHTSNSYYFAVRAPAQVPGASALSSLLGCCEAWTSRYN